MLISAWPVPEEHLDYDELVDVLAPVMKQDTVPTIQYMSAESYHWGVFSAPITTVAVFTINSRVSGTEAVRRIHLYIMEYTKSKGHRESGWNQNPTLPSGKLFILVAGWDCIEVLYFSMRTRRGDLIP